MAVDTAAHDSIDTIDADLELVDRYILIVRGSTLIGAILLVALVIVASFAVRDLWPPRAKEDPHVGRQL